MAPGRSTSVGCGSKVISTEGSPRARARHRGARSASGGHGATRRTPRRSPRSDPSRWARRPARASAHRTSPAEPFRPPRRRSRPASTSTGLARPSTSLTSANAAAVGASHRVDPGDAGGAPARDRTRDRSASVGSAVRTWNAASTAAWPECASARRARPARPGYGGVQAERADPGAPQRGEVAADAERRRRGPGPAPGRRCRTSSSPARPGRCTRPPRRRVQHRRTRAP